jgi:xylulokinase
MEGVAASMGLCLDLIRAAGIEPSEAVASGGGFASPLWSRMHADAFGIPLVASAANEGSARGAALLAGIGVGATPLAAAEHTVTSGPALSPDPRTHAGWRVLMEKQRFLQRNPIAANVKN